MTDARVMLFDIEASHLKANFGYCICFGYKFLGAKRARVLAVSDYKGHASNPTDDSPLMHDIHNLITTKADIIVTFYGKEYDRKFLNTRMLMAGLPPLPPLNAEHVDLYFTARGNLALNSNRLAMVADTLGCPMEKTPLSGPIWIKAMAGDLTAINYIKRHCIRDVEILEYVYEKLKPFVRQHPPVSSEAGACRVCGGMEYVRQGFRMTYGLRGAILKQRLQCKGCGGWSQGAGK